MRPALISHSPVPQPVCDVLHGVEVEDAFRWLEDQDSPATRAFIRAEQNVYEEYLYAHRDLHAAVETRVKQLLTVEVIGLPLPDKRGGLLYLKRKAEDEQNGIYHRRGSEIEEMVLSGEILGRDSYTSLSILQVSNNGRYLVYGLRIGGEDVEEIGIYDLEARAILQDRLPRGFCRGLVFDESGNGFYYSLEETQGLYEFRRAVRHHIFGDNQRKDIEVFYAGDGPSLRLLVQGSKDDSSLGYTVVSLESEPQTRFFIHRFPFARSPLQIVDLQGASFGGRVDGKVLEAITTHAAPLGRVVAISLDQPDPEMWRSVIPQTSMRLYRYERWNDARIVHYLDGPVTTTHVYSAGGEFQRELSYPASGTLSLGQVDEAHGRLFYAHSDVTHAPAIYALDLATGERVLWWRQAVPGKSMELAIDKYEYSSTDGVQIPITLIRRQGVTGPRPLLLGAYGAGGVSNTPRFSVLLTILAESGFSCATAHVRGGGEGGQQWHAAAHKQRKQTSVDDFVCAAKWLIEHNYTTPLQLAVAGQSNGALLVLCAITQQPHLFRAAMALGPIADLTRFHLFGAARAFVAELGSPIDPEEFATLYSLSPYHHVGQYSPYPAVLIISGDRDKRCDSLHARKMIAQLRRSTSQEHPILLDYSEERGHKPVLPLAERIRSLADRLTFLIEELSASSTQELIP